jgi:regulating synaptic membrane exocytosis protein 2
MTNLGHGQVVGRQALASPVLGEVQLAINFSNVTIDIEIIRAKNLVLRPGTRVNPGKQF